jgi:hypothetical protein
VTLDKEKSSKYGRDLGRVDTIRSMGPIEENLDLFRWRFSQSNL